MPHLTASPKTATRRVLRDADYAARGRQLAERKAEEYRKSRDRQETRGEAELWVWVPERHAALIRTLIVALCAARKAGDVSLPLLSWEQSQAAASCSTDVPAPCLPLDNRDSKAPAAEQPCEKADGPAVWHGMGLAARRRAQARRAKARKRAAGLKRMRLVVPRAFKSEAAAFLEEVQAGLEGGLLPVLNVAPTDSTIPTPGPAAGRIEVAAPPQSSTTSGGTPSMEGDLVTPGQVREKDRDMPSHRRGSHPAAVSPTLLRPAFDVAEGPAKGPRLLIDLGLGDELSTGSPRVQTSPLFEDIRALDRLPGLLRQVQPAKQDDG